MVICSNCDFSITDPFIFIFTDYSPNTEYVKDAIRKEMYKLDCPNCGHFIIKYLTINGADWVNQIEEILLDGLK